MKKFRKIELVPLTNSKDLNLDVVKTVKLQVNRNDEVDKCLAELFDHVKKNPDIKIGNDVGNETFVSTQIKSSSNKKVYTFPEPNPICIYYNIANEHLEKSYDLKNKINSKPQNYDAFEDYEYFSNYFNITSQGIIFLITTIEGFINQFFIEDSYLINGKTMTKKNLEWAKLDEKINVILPALIGINFKETNPNEYSKICSTNSLRNDLIHLKQSSKSNNTFYQELFKKTIDFKHFECSEAVYTFLAKLKPKYFTEKATTANSR